MRRFDRLLSLCVATGLLLGVTMFGRAQDPDSPKQADKPAAKKKVVARDADRDQGPRADRPADRPRSDRDRARAPRRGPDGKPWPRDVNTAPPVAVPPMDALVPGDVRGRRFPHGPGGDMRGPGGFPGIGGGRPQPGFGPGRPMGMPLGMGRPGMMRGVGPGMGPPRENADPEMFKLEQSDQEFGQRSMELAAAYRRAATDQRDALRKELRETIDAHFDVRQKLRELQLKRLEQQLEQLKQAIEKRAKVRNQIVERRISELTGEEDPLDF